MSVHSSNSSFPGHITVSFNLFRTVGLLVFGSPDRNSKRAISIIPGKGCG